MKVCLNCKLKYDDSYKFCKKCGNTLSVYQSNKQNNSDTSSDVNIALCICSNFLIFILAFSIPILAYFYFRSDSNNAVVKNTEIVQQPKNNEHVLQKIVEVRQKERVVPNNFKSINVLGRNIYLPKNFKRIPEEEKILYTSSSEHMTMGIALYGLVDYNDVGKNDKSQRYEIIVTYSQSPSFKNINSYVEEKSFEEGLKGTLISVGQSGDVKFISKEICNNTDGHKYLKAVYSVSEKGNLDNKIKVCYVLTFFDGKLYGIFMKAFFDSYLEHSSDFNIISKTFGTIQEL